MNADEHRLSTEAVGFLSIAVHNRVAMTVAAVLAATSLDLDLGCLFYWSLKLKGMTTLRTTTGRSR